MLARAGAGSGEWRREARDLPRQCPGLAVAGAAGSGSSGGAMGGIWESSISKSTRTRSGASERAWAQPSGDPGSAAPATLALSKENL